MYSRVLDGKTLSFGHEGVLFKRSFIMYDKGTKSLWVHTTGEAIKGPLKGKQLEFFPSTVTTWGQWKKQHPKTTVLTGAKAHGFMGAFDLERAFPRYGLSVGQGRNAKLYRYTTLKEKRVVNDTFEGEKIVVVFHAESRTALAFRRGDREFAFKDGKMVDGKGREWDLLAGTSKEEALERIPATPWLIERWRGFYPDAEIYR